MSRVIKSLPAINAIFVAVIAAVALTLISSDNSSAASTSGFNAGNIMSNAVMSNKSSMTEAQIQKFLKSKNSCNDTAHISSLTWHDATSGYISGTLNGKTTKWYYNLKDGHFVCMADNSFNGETAAHIIWQAAQDYNINPQVLIVLLQKEQGLITDTWPNDHQYAAATGYDCPDTPTGCNNTNAGFKNQIRKAAQLFSSVLAGGWTNYPVGTNYILYNPSTSCGGTNVNIQNLATSSLYRYTPYQPNKAALAAGYGTGDSCSAYGNRNFYLYFTDWFGSTQQPGITAIQNRYNALDQTTKSTLGSAKGSTICTSTATMCYQLYANGGAIIWSSRTGAWESYDPLRSRWRDLGFESGELGYPIGAANKLSDGGMWQKYQHGYIIWNSRSGAWESKGGIRTRWSTLGSQTGIMGYPAGPETQMPDGGYYQKYQNGYIIWSSKTDAWESYGPIRTRWGQLNSQSGVLGYPTGPLVQPTTTSAYQRYQNGYIVGKDATGYWESKGAIRTEWGKLGYETGIMGYPSGPETQMTDGGIYQKFENGYVVGKSTTGYWESMGPIRSRWSALGGQTGELGYPLGSIAPTADGGSYQKYQHGYIIGKSDTGYWESKGAIRTEWGKLGYESGKLGYPISAEVATKTGWYQNYQHGRIYYENRKYRVVYN